MDKVITALKPQQSHPDRMNLYLDGNFAFGISARAAAELHLGDHLNDQQIESLRDTEQLARTYEYALRYINYRPRTRKELHDRLVRRGIPIHIVTVVVDRVENMGLINDQTFTRLWVESRAIAHPKSRRMLAYELKHKGVTDEVMDVVFDGIEDDLTLARRALDLRARRWQDLEKPRFIALAGAFLARRGFSYETIRMTLADYWDAELANI